MSTIDELDWQIIDALQTNPRASWTLIGQALDVNAITVSRRWQRLHSQSLAWVGAYPSLRVAQGVVGAMIEVKCAPGTKNQTANLLAEHPYAINVDQTAGARDVVMISFAPGAAAMHQYLAQDVETVARVQDVRSSVITGTPIEGSAWRSGALDEQQMELLRPDYPAAGDVPLRELDYHILAALAIDGRASIRDLAEQCGTSTATIGRRLPLLLGSRSILLCADIARTLSDRPLAAILFAKAAAHSLPETVKTIAALPGVRSCFSLAGPRNLHIGIWIRKPADVHQFETLLDGQNLPLTVQDRSVVLRGVKYNTRILDDQGRAIRIVPYQYPFVGPHQD